MHYPGQGHSADNLVRIVYYNGCVWVVDVWPKHRLKRYTHVTKGLELTTKESMQHRSYYKR